MQFAIGATVLECSFVKHSHGPLGVNVESEINVLHIKAPFRCSFEHHASIFNP
jgi:hypothetical protein